jgi:hypothetical protein
MKKKSDLHGLDRVNTDIRSLTNQIKDLKAKVTALEKQKGGKGGKGGKGNQNHGDDDETKEG